MKAQDYSQVVLNKQKAIISLKFICKLFVFLLQQAFCGSKLVPRGVVPATTSVVMYELDPKGVVHATTSVVT